MTDKFKMEEFAACGAQKRPEYCKMETNYCCFNCEHQKDCMVIALRDKLMRPCGIYVFDMDEVCEFAL